jgi:hypothetical protein
MIRMKALRSGNFGPNGEKVRRGREFDVKNEQRMREIEAAGDAHRVELKAEPLTLNKMDTPASNKAAEAGPLDSAGGMTGEAETAPSSRQAPRPPQHRSSRYKAASES